MTLGQRTGPREQLSALNPFSSADCLRAQVCCLQQQCSLAMGLSSYQHIITHECSSLSLVVHPPPEKSDLMQEVGSALLKLVLQPPAAL